MELLFVAAIYIAILAYLVFKLLRSLLSSAKRPVRLITMGVLAAFAVIQLWLFAGFFRNADGKSFTVGWFALAYFEVTSFTVFAVICWTITLINGQE